MRGREAEQRLRDLERARTAAEEAEAAQPERECGEARYVQENAAAMAEEAAEQVRRLEQRTGP